MVENLKGGQDLKVEGIRRRRGFEGGGDVKVDGI
jgi:hypothetical protein